MGVPRFGRKGVKNTVMFEGYHRRTPPHCSGAAPAYAGGRNSPFQELRTVKEEVEIAWVGMGILPGPLVPLSRFSSSPWVDGLYLSHIHIDYFSRFSLV